MAHKRSEVPELEKMLQYGRKIFVRYDEGAKLYSMGLYGTAGARILLNRAFTKQAAILIDLFQSVCYI